MTLIEQYHEMMACSSPAPTHWARSCTHDECTFHQLSPYIGKLKSIIARDLISQYSRPGELVADVFCGSGTVPLEAARLGRRPFASDSSPYAVTLTNAKLQAPKDVDSALNDLEGSLEDATHVPVPDIGGVPQWVRQFYHPKTLTETLRFVQCVKAKDRHFFLASVLGILHHQRPGFLSFPSSHLVPYLRSTKYPRTKYPQLYEYRPIAPRIRAKVIRAFKRPPARPVPRNVAGVRACAVESVDLPDATDCIITSPPYMNALDYVRDNRLRLWFLDPHFHASDTASAGLQNFRRAMKALAGQVHRKLKVGGYCVFVVGERTSRKGDRFPSEELVSILASDAPSLSLCKILSDTIPDVRRSRRRLAGVKREQFLVLRKGK